MAKCSACGKFLKPTGGAGCGICPRMYHKLCVGLSDVQVVDKGWACPECKKVKPKTDNSNTPVKGVSATTDSPLNCGETSEVLSSQAPSTLLTEDDYISEIKLMRRDFAECMKELRDFREEFRRFRSDVNERMDGVEQRLLVVEQQCLTTSQSQEQVSELHMTVARLRTELNERDQEALLSDLDIGHLPEDAGENVGHTVTVLASKLGVALKEHDIVYAERVGRTGRGASPEDAQPARPRRVVVRLARRSLRDELLRAARVRRTLTSADVGLAGVPRRIYLNERMTPTNRQIFHRTREECRKREWRYCWTKRGRVFVRKGDGTQVYPIRTNADIDRVFDIKEV